MDTTLKNGDIMILDKVHYRHNKIKRFDKFFAVCCGCSGWNMVIK